MSGGFRVVVPLLRLADVLPNFDAPQQVRQALAIAFARDTLRAATAARQTRDVLVATSDPTMASIAAEAGAHVLAGCADGDEIAVLDSARLAVAQEGLRGPTAVLSSALPCMLPAELDKALNPAVQGRVEVLDLAGISPTLRASTAGWPNAVKLGPSDHSRRPSWRTPRELLPGLSCAVTTLEGLRVAAFLGVGQATHEVLRDLALPGLAWRCA